VPEGDWDDHDSELVVALYCVHATMAAAAMEEISEHGPVTSAAVTGVPQHSPWRKVLHEASEGVMKFGEILNLTPDQRYHRQNRRERAERLREIEQRSREATPPARRFASATIWPSCACAASARASATVRPSIA
jgi:phage terminase small subunit